MLKYECQLTRTDIVFCSISCRNRNYKNANPDWHPPNFKEYKHTCRTCKRDFVTNGSDHNTKNRIYCSRTCSSREHRPGKKHSDATKAKLSVAAAKQNRSYKHDVPYTTLSGETLIMRSTWELKYAQYLDSRGIKWQYEPEFILNNGKIYLPDFLLEDGSVVEIKGYFRLDAKVKWDMFCVEYPDLKKVLLQKSELKKLGII